MCNIPTQRLCIREQSFLIRQDVIENEQLGGDGVVRTDFPSISLRETEKLEGEMERGQTEVKRNRKYRNKCFDLHRAELEIYSA